MTARISIQGHELDLDDDPIPSFEHRPEHQRDVSDVGLERKCAEALDEIREQYPGVPETGPNGEKIVGFSFEVNNSPRMIHAVIGPGARPTQEYEDCDWETDDEGEDYRTNVRTVRLSDEEYARVLATYETQLARFKATGGRTMVLGPRSVEATFVFADGSKCSGVLGATGWIWTEHERV